MEPSSLDIQSRFVNALRTQASKAVEPRSTRSMRCPYCFDEGMEFQDLVQLLDHARVEQHEVIKGLNPASALSVLLRAVSGLRDLSQVSDIRRLTDEAPTCPNSLSSGSKRRADSDIKARREEQPSHIEIQNTGFSRKTSFEEKPRKGIPKPRDFRLYNHRKVDKNTVSPRLPETKAGNERLRASAFPTERQPGLIELQKYDPRWPVLILQPESRPISQEQLASEVKSIYAGLTMVETKCIHVDRAQAAALPDDKPLAPDYWQALIALHSTLLHEHHNFFLASQHPSAPPAIRRLVAKYTMPARMWKHGIHSFLELLRQKLPRSLDYMLAFMHLAYRMMTILYEGDAIPASEDTWSECHGDVGRYWMAIEDEDPRDREIWASIARSCYSKAPGRNPTVGRLYHHLAIPAPPNALQQLLSYMMSLRCSKLILNAPTPIDPLIGQLSLVFERPEGQYAPLSNTRLNAQWLSDSLQNILSQLSRVLKSYSAQMCTTLPLPRALVLGLLVQKAAAASNIQPLYVSSSTGTPPPSLGPLLVDKTPFDYAMYGTIAIYLAGACAMEPLAARFLGPNAAQRVHNMFKYCSLTLTAAMAFVWIALMGDELAAGIYISVVKIWAATTLHFVVVDCRDATNRTLHIVTYLGFSIVFEFIGLAMQQSAAPSALKALPPSLTVAAVINWAVYIRTKRESSTGVERVRLIDIERGDQRPFVNNDDVIGENTAAIRPAQQSARQETGLVSSGSQVRRRNSIHTSEDTLTTDNVGSSSNNTFNRIRAALHGQEHGTVHSADRPGHNARHQQNRNGDPRFAIGDGFDDVSLHH